MTFVRSFTQIERELMHRYRRQINHAESEEDIKKFFAQTMQHLLDEVMQHTTRIEENDAVLKPGAAPYFTINARLRKNESFKEIRKHSDLDAVLKRFAAPAAKRYRHLRGHPEKTESKIRHFS